MSLGAGENTFFASSPPFFRAARLVHSTPIKGNCEEDVMKSLTKAASGRIGTSPLVSTAVVILGWLLFTGLFFTAVTRPAALDASIEKILAGRTAPESDDAAVSALLAEHDARPRGTRNSSAQ
jgi:hypothetical protein